MRTFGTALVAAALLTTAACGGGDGGSSETSATTAVSPTEETTGTTADGSSTSTSVAPDSSVADAMRTLVAERIVANHRAVVTAATDLAAAAESSCGTDRVPMEEALRETRLAWDSARVYRLGPHTDRRLLPAVDWWPADVEKVEEAAAGDAPMTTEELDALGSPVRGLRVIEHLIYEGEPTLRRCSYIQRAAESVAEKTAVVADEFEAGAEAFAVSEMALGDVIGALGESVYRVCDEELGMPSGGNLNAPEPDLTAVREGGAQMALVDVRAQLGEVKVAYTSAILPLVEARYPDEPDPLASPFEQVEISLDLIGDDLVTAIETAREFVVGATGACRDLRRNIILTLAGVLGIVLVLPVGDGD